MSRTWIYTLAVLAIATVLCAGSAMAQIPDDVYFVSYFSNAHGDFEDATVRIDNPGVDAGKNLCAYIYVFDNVEEQVECCGCLVTPDGLRTISVNNGLTDTPSSGPLHKPTNGVFKIVSGAPNFGGKGCDPTGGASLSGGFKNNIVPTPDVRAWATHIQANGGTTEEEFADATLTQTELNGLQQTCFGLRQLGSGKGVCSCGFGD
jgi:hypothetical protein